MEELNIRELREIAEKATPGPWVATECLDVWVESDDGIAIAQCGDFHWVGADGIVNTEEQMKANARFFTTFDPPTVLALLSSAEAREEAEGWLYTSDDGVEWSDNHPIESGEVSDARDVRPATAKALLHELTAAWETYHEQRAALQAAETRAQQLEARVERAIQAADAILARVTMVAGRYLYDVPSADLVPVLAEEKVELTAQMFRELYNATSRDGSEIR